MGWLNHLNEQHRLILILWLLLMAGGPESVVGKKTTRKPMTTNRVGSSGITPTLNKITAPASSPKVDSSESYLPTEHIDLVDPIRTQFDLEEQSRFEPLQKPCRLQVPDEKNILLSYQDRQKPLMSGGADVLIPHGTTLLARCPVLGSMKLLGKSSIHCSHGKWSHRLPTCLPTTPADGLSPFIDDHPPTIITNVPFGSAGENPAGELVLRPKSVVHLDCVFYRRLGTPNWFWTGRESANLTYPITGWAVAKDERQWRFRLSIFGIQPQHEGEYTCTTPRGHSNSIRIVVQTIKCPVLNPVEPPLTSVLEGNFAGQSTFYFCPTGFRIQGPRNTTCLTSGRWSESTVPQCEFIQCPYDIDGADPRLEFDFLNGAGYGSMIKFSCPSGYQLVGPTNATCRENMNWYPPPAYCEAIKCEELLPPLNGRIVDSAGSHFVGDTVKFSCNRNFLLVGQSDIVCTDDGTWSHPSPQCQLSCLHPGEPISGYLAPNQISGYYEIGATVQVSCYSKFKLHGRSWIVCQQDGSWSAPVGECIQIE